MKRKFKMNSALDGVRPAFRVVATVVALACTMSACSSDTDKDGVPVVDLEGTIVDRQRMLTVKGKQMSMSEFRQTYCMAKRDNETCARAGRIASLDVISGSMKDLPKGLVPGKRKGPAPTPLPAAPSSGGEPLTQEQRESAQEFLYANCVVETPRYVEDCERTRRRLSDESTTGRPKRF